MPSPVSASDQNIPAVLLHIDKSPDSIFSADPASAHGLKTLTVFVAHRQKYG